MNGRNIMNLTALVPGVVAQGSTEGNALTGKNIFAAGNYQIGGGFANQGAVYYDGVPANSALGNLVNMVQAQTQLRSSAFRPTAIAPNTDATRAVSSTCRRNPVPTNFMAARTSTSAIRC